MVSFVGVAKFHSPCEKNGMAGCDRVFRTWLSPLQQVHCHSSGIAKLQTGHRRGHVKRIPRKSPGPQRGNAGVNSFLNHFIFSVLRASLPVYLVVFGVS